jgi:hypothetical protein
MAESGWDTSRYLNERDAAGRMVALDLETAAPKHTGLQVDASHRLSGTAMPPR